MGSASSPTRWNDGGRLLVGVGGPVPADGGGEAPVKTVDVHAHVTVPQTWVSPTRSV